MECGRTAASGKLLEDLDAVVGGRPDGIVLPKVSSVRELQHVGRHLSTLEARAGLPEGAVRVIVIATETPRALLTLGEYNPETAGARLGGLTWGWRTCRRPSVPWPRRRPTAR